MPHPGSRGINITEATNSLDSTYNDYWPMIFQLKGPFASVSFTQDLAMEKRHDLEAEGNKLYDQKDVGQIPDRDFSGNRITTQAASNSHSAS